VRRACGGGQNFKNVYIASKNGKNKCILGKKPKKNTKKGMAKVRGFMYNQ